MAQHLRQSTQVVVVIGPFVDVGDGFTPETGVTLSGADEAELLKANTTTTTDISGATWAAITGCDGYYGLTLTTSHTDTVGPLTVMVNDDSVCLPVLARFQVIEEAAYDSFYAASADPKADINVASIDANAITAAATAADFGTEVATAVWANATRTLSALDEDSTTLDLDATIRAAVGLAAADLDTQLAALPTAAENADAVWDEDATGHQTGGTFGQAIGDPGADTNTIFKAVVTDATGATVGVDVAAVLVDTGTTLDGKIDTIDTVVDAIKVQTDKLTFTVANQVDANIQSVNDVTITGDGSATPFNV